MTVLVTAASKHGATSGIAARIGASLAERGVEVDVKPPDEVQDLAGYEAFVVGSGVYMGRWLKSASAFVRANADKLSEHPTWLFSSGPIPSDRSVPADPRDAANGDKLGETVHARDHKVFAGKLQRSELSFAERAVVRVAHAGEGDHRDWQAVDEWAAAIADDLQEAQRGAVCRLEGATTS